MAVDLDTLRELALELPEAEQGAHHGHADFRVRKKIFVGLARAGQASLKTTPDDLEVLTRADPEAFLRIWGDRWVGVVLERVSADELRPLLERSWELAAPKALIRAWRESS